MEVETNYVIRKRFHSTVRWWCCLRKADRAEGRSECGRQMTVHSLHRPSVTSALKGSPMISLHMDTLSVNIIGESCLRGIHSVLIGRISNLVMASNFLISLFNYDVFGNTGIIYYARWPSHVHRICSVQWRSSSKILMLKKVQNVTKIFCWLEISVIAEMNFMVNHVSQFISQSVEGWNRLKSCNNACHCSLLGISTHVFLMANISWNDGAKSFCFYTSKTFYMIVIVHWNHTNIYWMMMMMIQRNSDSKLI